MSSIPSPPARRPSTSTSVGRRGSTSIEEDLAILKGEQAARELEDTELQRRLEEEKKREISEKAERTANRRASLRAMDRERERLVDEQKALDKQEEDERRIAREAAERALQEEQERRVMSMKQKEREEEAERRRRSLRADELVRQEVDRLSHEDLTLREAGAHKLAASIKAPLLSREPIAA